MTIMRSNEHGIYVVQCEDSADLDTSKEKRVSDADFKRYIERAHSGERRHWMGGTTAQIAKALAHGWPEGQERVQRLADAMRGTVEAPKSYRRRQRWSEDGDEPSWEREQYGMTDIWRTSRRDVMVGPTAVEFLAPWSHSGMFGADQLMWNGVVIAVLTDLLEEAGYRIGITLANAGFIQGRGFLGLVNAKRPQNPLDMASLIPLVVHPGVYRWHGIAMEGLDDRSGNVVGGLSPANVGSVVRRALTQIPKDSIELNRAYNEDAARKEIQRVLALFMGGHPHAEQGVLV